MMNYEGCAWVIPPWGIEGAKKSFLFHNKIFEFQFIRI